MKALMTSAALAALMASGAQAADLRMSWWGGDSRHVMTQEALRVCGEKHGHTIKAEFTGFDGYLEKLTTQMAGGTEADIVQVNWPWMPLFSRNGTGFADIREFSDQIDLSQWTEEQLASGEMAGILNGLPVSTSGRVFFFNTTTFEEAGVPLPTTWEELFEASAQLKEKLGQDYFAFNGVKETAQLLVSLQVTQMTGKDLVDPETNRVAWTVDELAEGLAWYGRMVEEGVLQGHEQEAGQGNVNLFEKPDWASGKIAGSYEWDSTWSKFADPMIDDQVLVPAKMLVRQDAVTEGVYRKPSMLFAISKNSANPEAAAEIINCMLNEPEGIDALGDSRGIPASAVAEARLAEAGAFDPKMKEAHDILMAAEGPVVSPFNEHPTLRGAFLDTMEEYGYGMLDEEEAAEIIIDEANRVLKGFDS
ncbi:ABC transporter substrate-binding protein [Falsirhodobacter deserti]|uniref:ABC transporter substrate-binding protein n=1 Tax=Falsirhodobacter deserti TaxID=1365611 RepID=UPI000FE2F2A3|nr:ABC transporter substrate-binding protein [Falsirhodobacter deserti]